MILRKRSQSPIKRELEDSTVNTAVLIEKFLILIIGPDQDN